MEKLLHDVLMGISRHCSAHVDMKVTLSDEAHYVLWNLLHPGDEYVSRLVLRGKGGAITIDNISRNASIKDA